MRNTSHEREHLATLHVGDERSSLDFSGPSSPAPMVYYFALGLQQLVREVLKHAPPTPGELESAIAVIEDEVMKAHKVVPANASLVTTDAWMWELVQALGPQGHDGIVVSIDEVEQLFDLLAALSMGRPASIAGIPGDARFAAALLMVRELMHHLHFPCIQVFKS